MKYAVALLLPVCHLAFAAGLAAASDVGREAGPVPAEKAGWKLHFSDDFKRSDLGDDWKTYQGNWSLKDGALQGSGCILSTRGFPDDSWGFTRIECEVEIAALPKGDRPDLDVLMHARPPEKYERPPWTGGYVFRLGGLTNASNRIVRDGKDIGAGSNLASVIVPGAVHRIVVENSQGQLRFFVDDKLIMGYEDTSPFFAGKDYNRVGFHFGLNVKVSNVKVYIKRMDDTDRFI